MSVLDDLLPEHIAHINNNWGKLPPWKIGAKWKAALSSDVVKAAAKELGLPPYKYPRGKGTKPRSKVAPPPPEHVPPGMVKLSNGHFMPEESFRILKRVREQGSPQDEHSI